VKYTSQLVSEVVRIDRIIGLNIELGSHTTKMEMQHMLERLLAGQAHMQAKADANMKNNQEMLERLEAKIESNQVKMAKMESAKLKSDLAKKKINPGIEVMERKEANFVTNYERKMNEWETDRIQWKTSME
jgi:hypothetical protein